MGRVVSRGRASAAGRHANDLPRGGSAHNNGHPMLWDNPHAMTRRVAWVLLVVSCHVQPLRADGEPAFGRKEGSPLRLVDERSRSPPLPPKVSAIASSAFGQASQACKIFSRNEAVLMCCLIGNKWPLVPKVIGWRNMPKTIQKDRKQCKINVSEFLVQFRSTNRCPRRKIASNSRCSSPKKK